MGFNFPSTPSTGQIYTPAGGPTFQYNGAAWQSVTQGIPVMVYVSDVPPVSPALGQLWWDSDSGNTFIWFTDTDSSQWVQISGAIATQAPIDGGEYVMRNGVWRLKSQSYDMTGQSTLVILVPTWGPKQARLTGSIYIADANAYLFMQISVDGTNFISGATEYQWGGFYNRSASGYTVAALQGTNTWYLTNASDNPALPLTIDTYVTLIPNPSSIVTYTTRGSTYHSTAGYIDAFLQGYVTSAIASVKILRLLTYAGFIPTRGVVTVEWLE